MFLVVYWIIGLGFMINFARFVLYGRQVFRPGLLWFIRDPNDPEFHPMREILEDRVVPQLYKIVRSVCMYCSIIVGGVFGTCWAARHLINGVFPLRWKQGGGGIESYGLFVCLVPGLLSWYHTKDLVQAGLRWTWRRSCGWWRLSEFVVGERKWAEEGAWYYRGYRMPRLLCLDKDGWVEEKCMELVWYDRARQPAGDQTGSNCLPTTEYRQRMQQHLDYPDGSWEFVLDGENLRVPRIDIVPVVKGRQMLVPVDDFGRPKDSMHDYETADDPEKRRQTDAELPRAAPEGSYRRHKFNPKDHMVVYGPPHLRWRVVGFVGTVWGLVTGSLVLVLTATMVVGRRMQRGAPLDRENDMSAFALGLVATVGGLIAARKGWISMAMTGREVRIQLSKTWAAVWKTQAIGLLFFGVLPLLYGALIEVYVVIGLRDRLGVEERGWVRAMASNWLFCATQVLVVKSVVPVMWPDSQVAREIDRDFTGPFHTWQTGRAIRRLWWPVVQLCVVFTLTPFLLVAIHFYWTGQGWQEFRQVVALGDAELLSWYSHIHAAVFGAVVGAYQLDRVYREWWRTARDREYLVGQQLHNLAN